MENRTYYQASPEVFQNFMGAINILYNHLVYKKQLEAYMISSQRKQIFMLRLDNRINGSPAQYESIISR
jgi:hypothetical protein